MMNQKYLLLCIVAVFAAIFITGCSSGQSQQSQDNSQAAPSDQGIPPTAAKECPSVYDGTYQGIFTYDYEVLGDDGEVVKTGTDGVSLTLTLKCHSIDEENEQVYLKSTNAIASDPYFECQVGGCVPLEYNFYDVLLPLNPPTTATKQSKIGEGLQIYFPNGAWIITSSAEGELHVGFDGKTLSNSLTGGDTWSASKVTAVYPFPGPDSSGRYIGVTKFKSWTLSKTT